MTNPQHPSVPPLLPPPELLSVSLFSFSPQLLPVYLLDWSCCDGLKWDEAAVIISDRATKREQNNLRKAWPKCGPGTNHGQQKVLCGPRLLQYINIHVYYKECFIVTVSCLVCILVVFWPQLIVFCKDFLVDEFYNYGLYSSFLLMS